MKTREMRTFIRNRLLFALPFVTGLVYGAWRLAIGSTESSRYGTESRTGMENLSIPPALGFAIYLAIAIVIPLLITGTVLYFILREGKVESSVDYLTYIDQTSLKEFQWDEDAVSHLNGSLERSLISRAEEAAVSPLSAAALKDDLSDLPDYDPDGPSPFKK